MTLPSTYYDSVRELRPYVIDLAEKDARDLLKRPKPPAAIDSVDDFDSHFAQCYEHVDMEILNYAARETGYSVEQLRPHLQSAMSQMPAKFTGLYSTVNYEYHVFLNFALSGKKTFFFTDNLADHLANTEINLKGRLFHLPFTSCLFTFTSRVVIDSMYDLQGNSRLESPDYAAPISVFLTMLPAADELSGRRLVICVWHARMPEPVHCFYKRELFVGDDWTLEQVLKTDWEDLQPQNIGTGMSIDVEGERVQHEKDDPFYTDGLTFFRIILNAALYLSSEQADPIPCKSLRQEIEEKLEGVSAKAKRRKLQKKAARYSILDYSEVGTSLGRILIQKDGSNDGVNNDMTKSKPLVKFMVRGHWRRQPCGPGNQERKLIWIRPYCKGPDIAGAINKPYVVK